jgi:hypothetical protein
MNSSEMEESSIKMNADNITQQQAARSLVSTASF